MWKVLCGHSENPSVRRLGHIAVARISKHITVFAFDLFFSLYILHRYYLLIFIYMLDIVYVLTLVLDQESF